MKIAIAGDISITKASEQVFGAADERAAFNNVIDVFKGCDRVIVNLECALTESENKIRKIGPNLKGPKNGRHFAESRGYRLCPQQQSYI